MYLACNDEVIMREQEKVLSKNSILIDEYNELSFWRWRRKEELMQHMRANWWEYEKWMHKRMEEMSTKGA